MSASVRVSFVVPTRNQARFIRKCLDSCLAQGLTDREILVVDGASEDGTLDILRSYGDKIRFVSEADSGQSEAVNKGIAMAAGDVIAWINSDDYYPHAEVLPRVLTHFARDSSLDIVFGDGQMVDAEGRPFRVYKGRPIASAKQLLVHAHSPLSQPAAFFKKALFERVGGLEADLHYTLDYDLWIRMWLSGARAEYVPEIFACACYHEDAKSIRGMLRQMNETSLLKLRYSSKMSLGAADWLRMSVGIASLYAYWAVTRTGLRRAQ